MKFQRKEARFHMAKKGISLSGVAMGVIAVVAGILVIFSWALAKWIIGIFLIVWGVLAIIDRR